MSGLTKPTFSLVYPELTPEEEKRERLATPHGMALVCFCYGEGVVLQWQANQALRNYMEEVIFVAERSFSLSDFDPAITAHNIPDEYLDQYNELQSGIFIAKLSLVDAGPESWEMPHIRDIILGLKILHPVSKEEWEHYLRDEWAWDFEEDV